MKKVKMSYITNADLGDLELARTVDDVLKVALTVIERMPKPVRCVIGSLTSGRRTPEENRERLHRVILRYKEGGVATFNHLPFQRRAMQILSREFGGGQLSDSQKMLLQERLRDEFYEPFLKSGKVGQLHIMPGSEASLNVYFMWMFATKNKIPVRFIPAELVPKE
jgi:hypothetical protein